MLIAIPSKGRAGKVRSLERVVGAELFVPNVEMRSYELAYPDESLRLNGVPSDIRGITATRNWILDRAEGRGGDPWVVFVDDDVRDVGWRQLYVDRTASHKLSAAAVTAEFAKLCEVADGMGFTVWGASTETATRSVMPQRPFTTRGYVTASCMGMRADRGVRFDEEMIVKEDYELCLRMMRDEGGVLGARYFYWKNEHWTGAGGCFDYRTQEVERAAIARLQLLYPGWVKQVTKGGSEYSVELTI